MGVDKESLDWVNRFNAHLDTCSQCRNHCFDLCPVGAKILTSPPMSVQNVIQREMQKDVTAEHEEKPR